MSGTNDTLNPGPVACEPVLDYSVQDLTLFNDGELRELKQSVVLKKNAVEDELTELSEASEVRLADCKMQWDEYLGRVQERIDAQEAKLEKMKAYLAVQKKEKTEALKAVKAENKEARNILVASESFLNDSLSALTNALKALARMKTRQNLPDYILDRNTWIDDED